MKNVYGMLPKLAVFAAVVSLGLAPALAGGTVSGKVVLNGSQPKDKVIKMGADPNCEKIHSEPVLNDNYTTNEDGTVHNVFVYLEGDALKGKSFPAPADAVQFDQKGCQYTPKVLGVMVDQDFEIINSDPTLHNVHALPKNSKEFNLGMPTQGMKVKKKFSAAERMVKIKCDVHPWMFAYVGVMEHPFHATTATAGTFEIKDVPPGKYTLYAWHKKYADPPKEMAVEVTEGGTATVDITVAPPVKKKK